nr:pentatricopeptide repeat-containing protein At1g09190 [Ipomoea batatas]
MRRAVERRILSLLHGQSTRTHLTQIHAHILRHLLHNSNQVLTHFVSVCGSQNKMDYANIIFQRFPYPNIFLFNSMIKGFSLCGPFLNSIALFSGMKNRGIWADEYTLAPLLKACSNLPDLRLGQAVHKEAIVLGFHRFTSIGIGIVELYSSCDRMVDAKRVFDEMSPRDVIVWNLMVQGYCRSGNVEMGLRVFRQMDERSIVSWNMMISWLARSGRDKVALELFSEMNGNGFEADEATVVTVLPICARLGEIEVGSWIHSYVDSKGLIGGDYVSVGNALVDFYCKCGDLEPASLIFKDMAGKNVVSWNAMISGLAFNGKAELGVQLFDNMISEGTRPNESTFVGVLACCTHAGLVQRGRDLFASMITNYDIEPTLEHYGCMVDLLGRNGHVKEAYDLIKSMPMKPNAAALWGSLLSALRTHGDMELAECTTKELISLEPWNSGNYVLLSNIYAEQGKWDEVEQVRELMRERNIMKEAGQSMVG